MSGKIQTVEKELDTLKRELSLLHETMDEAADAGNGDAVRKLQADIGMTHSLIASCERRLVKAKHEATEEGKASVRAANLAAVVELQRYLDDAAKLAPKIDNTLATLVQQLSELHAFGVNAREVARGLVRQLPRAQASHNGHLLGAAEFRDPMLGMAIENALARGGVFETLAYHNDIRLWPRDVPSVGDLVADRARKLPDALRMVVEKVNAKL